MYCYHTSNETDQWQTGGSIRDTHSSILWGGGCSAHAGSRCRDWYLAMTPYVLQIAYESTIMFLGPVLGNDSRLTSSWFSFPATYQAHVHTRSLCQETKILICFISAVFFCLYHDIFWWHDQIKTTAEEPNLWDIFLQWWDGLTLNSTNKPSLPAVSAASAITTLNVMAIN